jgi:hypothetical protein
VKKPIWAVLVLGLSAACGTTNNYYVLSDAGPAMVMDPTSTCVRPAPKSYWTFDEITTPTDGGVFPGGAIAVCNSGDQLMSGGCSPESVYVTTGPTPSIDVWLEMSQPDLAIGGNGQGWQCIWGFVGPPSIAWAYAQCQVDAGTPPPDGGC